MLKNFLTVGGWTMVSRVLGLVRDQLLAAFLGTGSAQAAYLVAFRLPNMFRRLFGEGAFNAAFVPMFTARLAQNGEAEARAFATEAMSALASWLLLITILGEILMPWLIRLIAPGFTTEGTELDLAVSLTRITFPYLVLICVAALVAGVLNSLHRFSMAAAAYVSFNVVGIGSILYGAFVLHDTAYAAAWGITISGIVQLGLLLWSLRRAGMTLSFGRPRFTPAMHDMIRRLVPGLIGSGVTQLNLTVDTMIATLLPAGSISWLYFADRMNQLPLGVLGAAAGTTLLPVLTRHVANGEIREGHATLNRTIDYALLLTLPACFGLITLAPEIMAGLFGFGHFTIRDAMASAQSLRAYAAGLPAFVLVKVLSPGFFAHGDTRTPVNIGYMTLALNLALNLALYRPLAHIGPPLASTLAALGNVALLGVILYRRDIFRPDRRLIDRLARMTAASALMSAATIVIARIAMPDLIGWHGLPRAAGLGALIVFAGALYLLLLALLGVARPGAVLGRLRRPRPAPLP
ncbi:integral membrane protein MviN [Neoasaia chiangmaiensis NBRC 101099]|uniref:Probable lipid II flippase MurJ n=1 Tax=Neoasaia chiangmaiensis TaxID=320497 RepID=A0A1U9KN54_9PROT|nr:murein biosynthesis integral membrane protein MurJ [Neoasaia chiangmaiensis]AQS87215.1 lipid II flippase MurJ [Neoasaia chiangmaiensis]GBR38362.1 integral membrane protein MviN [Neoasaia chiangmaiensis NBRC 101099]GEN15932.1 putative lipid II flippase MurJ [Neoasaia chiangmaiensis]